MKKFAIAFAVFAIMTAPAFAGGVKVSGSGVITSSGQLTGGFVTTHKTGKGKATNTTTVEALGEASGEAKSGKHGTSVKTETNAYTGTSSSTSLSSKGNGSASSVSVSGGGAFGIAVGAAGKN